MLAGAQLWRPCHHLARGLRLACCMHSCRYRLQRLLKLLVALWGSCGRAGAGPVGTHQLHAQSPACHLHHWLAQAGTVGCDGRSRGRACWAMQLLSCLSSRTIPGWHAMGPASTLPQQHPIPSQPSTQPHERHKDVKRQGLTSVPSPTAPGARLAVQRLVLRPAEGFKESSHVRVGCERRAAAHMGTGLSL